MTPAADINDGNREVFNLPVARFMSFVAIDAGYLFKGPVIFLGMKGIALRHLFAAVAAVAYLALRQLACCLPFPVTFRAA